MNFDITIANPGDLIGVSPTLSVLLQDGSSKTVFAKASASQSVLSVTKPDGTTATGTYLVSYGIELTTANKALGAAVFADPICMSTKNADWLIDTPGSANIADDKPWLYWGNCLNIAGDGVNSIVTAYADGSNVGGHRGYVNAVEIAWLVPFKIPNDRTEAKVACGLGGAATVTLDLLNIHAASVMSSGFGKGSCWYSGKATVSTVIQKNLLCRDLGEVASGSSNKLAF